MRKTNVEISVDYLDASDLSEKYAIKGNGDCPYIKTGKRCDIYNKCPIIKQTPEKISI